MESPSPPEDTDHHEFTEGLLGLVIATFSFCCVTHKILKLIFQMFLLIGFILTEYCMDCAVE